VNASRLVNENAGIWQSETLALGSGCQEQRSHRSTLADADGGYVRPDKLHGVVDGHARGDGTSGRVDIDVDIFLRILCFEEEKLGHDQIGNLIVDGRAKKK